MSGTNPDLGRYVNRFPGGCRGKRALNRLSSLRSKRKTARQPVHKQRPAARAASDFKRLSNSELPGRIEHKRVVFALIRPVEAVT